MLTLKVNLRIMPEIMSFDGDLHTEDSLIWDLEPPLQCILNRSRIIV